MLWNMLRLTFRELPTAALFLVGLAFLGIEIWLALRLRRSPRGAESLAVWLLSFTIAAPIAVVLQVVAVSFGGAVQRAQGLPDVDPTAKAMAFERALDLEYNARLVGSVALIVLGVVGALCALSRRRGSRIASFASAGLNFTLAAIATGQLVRIWALLQSCSHCSGAKRLELIGAALHQALAFGRLAMILSLLIPVLTGVYAAVLARRQPEPIHDTPPLAVACGLVLFAIGFTIFVVATRYASTTGGMLPLLLDGKG